MTTESEEKEHSVASFGHWYYLSRISYGLLLFATFVLAAYAGPTWFGLYMCAMGFFMILEFWLFIVKYLAVNACEVTKRLLHIHFGQSFLVALVWHTENMFGFKHIAQIIDSPLIYLLISKAQFIQIFSYFGFFFSLIFFVVILDRVASDPRKLRMLFVCYLCELLILGIALHAVLTSLFTSMTYGVFWTFSATGAVIFNDTAAFFIGRIFGRSPMTKLSPNKTLEGFFGAALATVIISIAFTYFSLPYIYFMISPMILQGGVPTMHLSQSDTCIAYFRDAEISCAYFHSTIIALVASFICPFGGLFCSGIKRATGVKHYGTVLGPHGGFVDRFDCKLIMGGFAYAYFNAFRHISSQ